MMQIQKTTVHTNWEQVLSHRIVIVIVFRTIFIQMYVQRFELYNFKLINEEKGESKSQDKY